MSKVRIIPTLLWKDVGLVKGIGFNSWRRVGSILPAIKVYNTRQVDEMIVVDTTASQLKAEPDFEMLSEIAYECFVPLTFGGGISSLDHITKALRLGADKISINTAALENPAIIKEAADKFGSQCVVVSIDAKLHNDGKYYCYKCSGSQSTDIELIAWAKQAEELGAGEILLTDIAADGTMQGYNISIITQVSHAVSIPVIASGGAGKLQDFYEAIATGHASAVAAASLFHFTELTPLEVKDYLSERNIPVRKHT